MSVWNPPVNIGFLSSISLILEKSCNICLAHPKYVKTIIAICRRLLVAIYHVLLKQESYNPRLQGLTEIRNSVQTMSVQDAVRFAQQHGFKVLEF